MKKLSLKHKIALVELVVFVAIVIWFLAPRSLDRTIRDFDPAAVTEVQAQLTAFNGQEGRAGTPSQGEAAFDQLLSLLDSKKYIPYYLERDAQRSIALDYKVQLHFTQGAADYTYTFSGDRAIDLTGDGAAKTYQVTDSDVFQQSVLDFLLEQEYTKLEVN